MSKAISNNNVVTTILKSNSTNENFLNICCYHMQQTIELSLKYSLEILGINYIKTHDIRKLLNLIETRFPVFLNSLIDRADDITAWESKSRYILSFTTTQKDILEVQDIFFNLLSEIKYNFGYILYNNEVYTYCLNKIKSYGYKAEKLKQILCFVLKI